MRTAKSVLLIVLMVTAFSVATKSFAQSQEAQNHTEWIAKVLKEIETVKPGMTRAELLNIFREEGGISTRKSRQYTHRDCAYIKVEVEFEPVGGAEDRELTEDSSDRIVKISRPFLEWAIID